MPKSTLPFEVPVFCFSSSPSPLSGKGLIFVLPLFICVHLWLIPFAFADPATPSVEDQLAVSASRLDKARDENQKLKDAWDKARLETTLYDQRAKRAYQKWVKAAKGLKEAAKARKEQGELEFQLAVEKRKLAYNEWQVSQLKMLAEESQVKALDQEKESASIRDRIGKLEAKLNPTKPADSR